MFTITGANGHVGGAAAHRLLDSGAAVRTVVRDPAQVDEWTRRGADCAVADLRDTAALSRAMWGSEGVFVLLPTDPTAGDAEHRRLADSIAAAVDDSGVPHVVVLSSVGADLAGGTGPIRWLHHLEEGLQQTYARLSVLRAQHFQERVETILPAALGAGVYPVFAHSADLPTPMVATRDIGALVAGALREPPAATEVVDLQGPAYTENQVADRLASLLGIELQVVVVPPQAWVGAMVDAGVPEGFAQELAELYDAEARGLLHPRGDRIHTCVTPLEVTLASMVDAAVTVGSVA